MWSYCDKDLHFGLKVKYLFEINSKTGKVNPGSLKIDCKDILDVQPMFFFSFQIYVIVSLKLVVSSRSYILRFAIFLNFVLFHIIVLDISFRNGDCESRPGGSCTLSGMEYS